MNVGAVRTGSRKPVWKNTITLPWAPTGQVFFSPIIQIDGEYIVYVIDQAQVFYSYNITTATWAALTGPDYTSVATSRAVHFNRTLCISPDESTIACISDGEYNAQGSETDQRCGGGRRIEFYDIATDAWTASSQTDFFINDSYTSYIRAIVWADNDTMWCWCAAGYATSYSGTHDFLGQCVLYTKSTDVWLPGTATFWIFSRLNSSTTYRGRAYPASINSAGTIVYLGSAQNDNAWKSYTIETDVYSSQTTLSPLTDFFAYAYHQNLLLYWEKGSNCQPGAYDTDAAYYADDLIAENADRDSGYGQYFGMSKNAGLVVALISASAPEIGIFTE